jgi:hypothetical protein
VRGIVPACALLLACNVVFPLGPDPVAIDAPADAVPYGPTNYDPTMLPAFGLSCVFATSQLFDTGMLDASPDGAALEHCPDVTVAADVTVTIRGDRPLIIVADGLISIQGTIVVDPPTIFDASCGANSAGDTQTNTSSGGGGGGFGAAGGTAGSSSGGGPTPGSGVGGTDALKPLRGGCPGGDSGDSRGSGGTALNVAGVGGGRGGGALELSSASMIVVSGSIIANGRGGQGGGAKDQPCANGGANNCTSGGGGGGSGGAILLEAPSVDVQVAANICAVGGGGGAGGFGDNTPTRAGLPGQDGGGCSGGPGGMGFNTKPGGQGGDVAPGIGGNGTDGGSGFSSGGGGGGGVGRIRVHSDMPPTLSGNIVPRAKP